MIAGFTKTTRRRTRKPRSGDGDPFRDAFPFPTFISISISTRRREIDSISVSLVDSAAPTGLFSIDDAGREEGEKTDALATRPTALGGRFRAINAGWISRTGRTDG